MEVQDKIEALLTEALDKIIEVMAIMEKDRGKVSLSTKAILIFDLLKGITNGVAESQGVLAYLMHYLNHLVHEPESFIEMINTSRRALLFDE